jgi:hypothetical protein
VTAEPSHVENHNHNGHANQPTTATNAEPVKEVQANATSEVLPPTVTEPTTHEHVPEEKSVVVEETKVEPEPEPSIDHTPPAPDSTVIPVSVEEPKPVLEETKEEPKPVLEEAKEEPKPVLEEAKVEPKPEEAKVEGGTTIALLWSEEDGGLKLVEVLKVCRVRDYEFFSSLFLLAFFFSSSFFLSAGFVFCFV